VHLLDGHAAVQCIKAAGVSGDGSLQALRGMRKHTQHESCKAVMA
jgi:hypothetical protein